MCGIAGIATWRATDSLAPILKRMTDPIAHRGPDDWGAWADNDVGIGLGQRRLSIIDLSPQGHQPMTSPSGRWVITFNGEIYNFAELKTALEKAGLAPSWRGHSDTEVLLACIEAWGVETTLQRATGMFAIALWDRSRRVLILARDRMGEKPLYYGRVGVQVLFGSELKAITAVTGSSLEVDRESLGEYLRFSYLPSPRSIWRGIHKLLPGHWLELERPEDADNAPKQYWHLGGGDHEALATFLANASDTELANEVESRLSESVRAQMVSDVPLGAFLSGGVDSSVIVALMQKHSSTPVQTFTIGFDLPEYNEAPYANAVAKHLRTNHTELYVTAKDAESLIQRIPDIYDEPFADSSQIPTTLVSQLTRRHVTVSLSGDGGDELFAGYPRYPISAELWSKVNMFPRPLRRVISTVLGIPSASTWDKVLSLLPGSDTQSVNGHRIHRLSQLLMVRSLGEMYVRLMSQWQPEEDLVLGLGPRHFDLHHWDDSLPPTEAMRRWDMGQYLPDDLLVKVDRASMSESLEVRAPFLNHRVAEMAFAMPERALIRNGVSKWALRQVLYRYVPHELIERPKSGFSLPLAEWLRGHLRPWAEDLLSTESLHRMGLLNPVPIRRLWLDHLSGRFDRSSYIWSVLMLQGWMQRHLATDHSGKSP
jgi:asparagine synthase (glutamine-hydrolysing)